MLASQVPANFPIPFANAAGVGYKNTIPQASQIGVLAGAASLTDGFPPLNFLPAPPYGSGVPPFGQDFNGILYEITASVQWAQAGGMPVYNSAFSAAIGGYPNGSVLLMASGKGMWMSTVDNNLTDPDTSGAGWKILSIAPGAYLDLSVAGAVNVTLTTLQAANAVIDMTGAITANIEVIVPTVTGVWTFSNTTTGAFAITVRTAAGTGVIVPQGTAMILYCDGTNVLDADSAKITQAAADARYALLGSQVYVGTIIDIAGLSAPTGYLACPTAQTNISRTTYAGLFAAIGTTWGAGDGSTTFGMPWFPAGYVAGQGTVGVQSVGSVISHSHTISLGTTAASSILALNASGFATTQTTSSTGGAANYAAIVGVLKCVKY
jgi:hypothetical protein